MPPTSLFLAVNLLLVLGNYVVSLFVSQFAVVGYGLMCFDVVDLLAVVVVGFIQRLVPPFETGGCGIIWERTGGLLPSCGGLFVICLSP